MKIRMEKKLRIVNMDADLTSTERFPFADPLRFAQSLQFHVTGETAPMEMFPEKAVDPPV